MTFPRGEYQDPHEGFVPEEKKAAFDAAVERATLNYIEMMDAEDFENCRIAREAYKRNGPSYLSPCKFSTA